jgi:glycerophosphoryl diester phosphodiesterase
MVEIIAHRGARSLAPENTLAAARLGHKLGAHRWETDAGLTLDGHLVLFHDDTLTRCSNAPEEFVYDPEEPGGMDRLDAYTMLELELLEAGSFFERTDPFSTLDLIEPDDLEVFRKESIPSLYDGLVLTRELSWQINIELKDHGNEPELHYIASRALAEIARAGIGHNRVVISSFNHGWLRWVRDRAPEIEIQALVGWDDDVPLNFTAPVFTNEEFPVLNINAKLITPKQLRELKARGKRINLFTVNEPHDYMRFVNAGADGIITDFPQRFIR